MATTLARAARWTLSPFLLLKDRPVLYRGKHFQIVGYGAFAAMAAVAVVSSTALYLRAKGESIPLSFVYLLPLMGATVWAGSKLMHILALGRKFFNDPIKYLTETGFYVQGGIFGAVVAATAMAHLTGISMVVLADGLAWGAMIGLFFGRLGCFNYGCCYGRECSDPRAGVSYHNHEVKALRWQPKLKGVSLYPTQLYTAGLHLIAFAGTGFAIMLVEIPNGLIGASFLAYHGITRLLIERLRADIYFDGQRNWTTFAAAVSMVLAGGLMLALGPFVSQQFWVAQPLAEPLRLYTLGALLAAQPLLLVSMLLLSALILFGYGVHGRQLGTYPWSPQNRDSQLQKVEVRR